MQDDMLTEKELAERLRCSLGWLRGRRFRNEGPPFYKVGSLVRYKWSEVLEWIGPPKAGKGGDGNE